MKESRSTEAQIVQVLGEVDAPGVTIGEVCAAHNVSESAFYRWRKRYGDLQVSEVRHLRELAAAGLTETAACRVLAISRSSFRYVVRAGDETEPIEAMREIRRLKRRWGYERVWARLRKNGHSENCKRIERLWRQRGFTQPDRRPKKKRRSGATVPGRSLTSAAVKGVLVRLFARHGRR